jgi:hypothetical protein
MQRRAVISVAIAAVFASASALAQDGDLSRVTMRVLDDLRDVDAVVLELDANRGEGEEGAESDGRDAGDAATGDESRDAARAEAAPDESSDLRRERDELHEDNDDRNEGRREDRDVERPVTPLAPVP